MPEFKESFKFEVVGALTVGVKDRWEPTSPGEITGIEGVVGTAPTGAAAVLDVTKNGTSLFAALVATTVANVSTTAPTVDVNLVPGRSIAQGAVVVIDTEQMTVTGSGGSPLTGPSGLGNVTRLQVTRAANGTVAAAHAIGVGVTYAPPSIAAGATQLLGANQNEALGTFVAGDVLALNVTQVGSTVAGADLDLIVSYVPD